MTGSSATGSSVKDSSITEFSEVDEPPPPQAIKALHRTIRLNFRVLQSIPTKENSCELDSIDFSLVFIFLARDYSAKNVQELIWLIGKAMIRASYAVKVVAAVKVSLRLEPKVNQQFVILSEAEGSSADLRRSLHCGPDDSQLSHPERSRRISSLYLHLPLPRPRQTGQNA